MVDIQDRLKKINRLVDAGEYFTINRARQYGKTTTLKALAEYLKTEYMVIPLDFQMMGNEEFQNAHIFSSAFADYLLETIESEYHSINVLDEAVLKKLQTAAEMDNKLA